MRKYQIVLLAGDGIGPEITAVAKQLLKLVSKKYNFELTFIEKLIGGAALDKTGSPLPLETVKECRNSDAILLAAIGSPRYDQLPREKRPETGLLNLRKSLNLFANIRPVKIIPALIESSSLKPSIIGNVDLIVVRELIGGIYFGQPKGRVKTNNEERAFNTMSYSNEEIKSIAKIAFDLASNREGKLCSVDKANVLDVSQLWRDVVEDLSESYPKIKLSHMYVDNAAMQLIKDPEQFDVILTGNLFGDILSDEAAMITGSIGMLPSASLSKDGPGVFEPVHGSAPDIAGSDKANPIAMVLSAAMMLRIALKEEPAANALEEAVEGVLRSGFRTPDINAQGTKQVGCHAMGKELMKALEAI